MKIEIHIFTKISQNWWGWEIINQYLKRIWQKWKIKVVQHKNPPVELKGYNILLDQRGKELSTEEFAETLEKLEYMEKLNFIIGGPYGVDKKWKDSVDLVVSMSKMTFPHQLSLIILVEQLYRTYTILSGHPYHH